jgi:hypothetical protein
MTCDAVRYNQTKPAGGISGLRPFCIATPAGLFIGDNAMKKIPLTQGKFALVDDEDYEWLSQWKWFAYKGRNTFYAARNRLTKEGPLGIIRMHRCILGLKRGDGIQTDHIDGDGLNNQRKNLRYCTHQENQRNRFQQMGTSRYKGVHWCNRNKRWMAKIFIGKQLFLGSFINEVDAAIAYNTAATKYFGSYAKLNIIRKDKSYGNTSIKSNT